MIRSRILRSLGIFAVAFVVSTSVYGQVMNAVELASHARAAARTLSDNGAYEAALKLLNSLEAGRYEVGDAAMQTAAAKIQGVLTDKGRILIKLGRYTDADAEFYRAFDANLALAEKDLKYVQQNGTGETPAAGTRLWDAFVSASGSVTRAKAVIDLRDATFILSGVAPKPFDAARVAKYESLKKGVARFMP